MAINLSALNNLTPLNFNTTDMSDPTTMVPALISTSNEVSQGYLGLGIMLAMFIVLVFATFRQDRDIRMDITRSIMFSSGMTSVLGFVMLATPLISSFIHVMWFLTIFIITVIMVFNMKRRGL